MTATPRPQRRVGAQHRAKLKKWSDKVAREHEARAIAAPAARPGLRRRRTIQAAKNKLRAL